MKAKFSIALLSVALLCILSAIFVRFGESGRSTASVDAQIDKEIKALPFTDPWGKAWKICKHAHARAHFLGRSAEKDAALLLVREAEAEIVRLGGSVDLYMGRLRRELDHAQNLDLTKFTLKACQREIRQVRNAAAK